ncbi:MAG: hypothetical protein ACYDH9_10390 [Limisphaerales bacterium]
MKTLREAAPLTVSVLVLFLGFSVLESPAALVVEIGQNFTGSTYGVDSDSQPADANGTIGPAHFVEFINGRYSVFDKTTGRRVQTWPDETFWSRAGVTLSANLGVTDARIVFDPASQRWFAAMVDFDFNTNASNRFLLALSVSADPTKAWRGFAFPVDPVNGNFVDFPALGVDGDGVYLGGDMFDSANNSLGPTLVAIPKSGLLAKSPTIAGRTAFGLLDYTARGYILQPAVSVGATGGGEAVLAVGDLGTDFQPHSTLVGFAVEDGDSANSATLTSPNTIDVPPYNIPVNPPQPDGSDNLDDGDTRFSATVYRVADVLYAVHSTQADNRAALEWFKLNATNFAVLQTGTITDNTLDLFYPSIAANAAGTVVIGCNGSSSNTFVSSYAVVGEWVNDTLTFGSLLLLKAGTASYQNVDPTDPSGISRWGDYSATSVDPADPNRFWTIQTYASGSSAWSTQITELITGPLTLTVSLVDTNILVSWPATAVGFQLQFAPSLSTTDAWTPVTQSPLATNGQFTVSLPALGSQGFFRVAKPL